jgi:hypothetical protein
VITILDDPSMTKIYTPIFENIPIQHHTLLIDFPFTTPSSHDHNHLDTTLIDSSNLYATTVDINILIPSSLP